MPSLPLFLLCLICALVAASHTVRSEPEVNAQQSEIEILVMKDVLQDLPEFLQGQSIEGIDHFDRPAARRDLVDYILLRQALTIGLTLNPPKPVPTIKITPWRGASYNRLISNLKLGQYTVFSHTLWREDFNRPALSTENTIDPQNNLYMTSATLRYGEIEAGLYMNPDNPKFQQQSDKINLANLRAVSSSQWLPDWQALTQLPLKHVYDEVKWNNMFRMVQGQHADFMLIPFSSEPKLSFTALGITLSPIQGVKVALAGSRGWAISRSHPTGKTTYQAIENGLSELRLRGVIPRAYIEAGVINANVAHWQNLNLPNVTE